MQVRNGTGGTPSNAWSLTVSSGTPTISNITPTSVGAGVFNETINGSNFDPATVEVVINGPSCAPCTVPNGVLLTKTSSQVVAPVTLGNTGTFTFQVRNGSSGTPSNSMSLTVNSVGISNISPTSRATGTFNLTINGSGFNPESALVVFTGPSCAPCTVTNNVLISRTPNQIVAPVTLNNAGTFTVQVRNGAAGPLSSSASLTITASPQPSITSISPSSPTSSNLDQNVNVFGSNFQTNLTVSVTFPGGGGAILSGTQIQSVTPNSFVVRITLGAAGNWSIRVNNPDGGQSNTFNFTAQSVIQPPTIFSLNPSNPFASSLDQDIAVFGINFQPNLTVSVTFPGGGGTTVSGAQIQNLTSSSFVLRVTLSATGNWSIRVNNPDSGQSSPFNCGVSGGAQTPVISSINPGTPITSGADQSVIVNGSNFQTGLRVDVSFANGGVGTLQGTGQIQNVTATSFLMRITLNGTGNWAIRVVNPIGAQSGQFNFSVQASGSPPSNLPTSVLSPVIGSLRVTISNLAIRDGKWEFNQYKTGFHTPTGGISLSNDTFAWDVNLYTETSGNADAGKAVYAVADGEVISYVGTPPGGGPGAVLIAHPNRLNPVWFSGYLHMTNVRVSLNQQINETTVIGEVGRVGANNDHLHFVVYSGQNTRGNLQSFNAVIIERTIDTTNPPTITLIEPNTVNQSSVPQLITISGTNFQSNSIIEAQAPNGQYFTVTPETVSGFREEAKIESIESGTITARVNFASAGTYAFSVINRPANSNSNELAETLNGSVQSSFAVSSSNNVRVVPSGRTPVILIPGIMGSRIGKREGSGFRNLWLGGSNGNQRLINNLELKNNVENPSVLSRYFATPSCCDRDT